MFTIFKNGFGNDEDLSKATVKLIALVERNASDANSAQEAKKLIGEGADIRARVEDKTMSMIASVRQEAKRNETVAPHLVPNCLKLTQVLEDHASELLERLILFAREPRLAEMGDLIEVGASGYQESKYGPLGLLGHLLQQQDIPIRFEVVELLIEKDPKVRYSLTMADDRKETCLSLSSKNDQCSDAIRRYLQKTLDSMLVRAAFDHRNVDANEIVQWIARGADMTAVDDKQNTALINAIETDHYELVVALLAAGCDLNHRDSHGDTPIEIARQIEPRNARLIALLETKSVHVELQQLIGRHRSRLKPSSVAKLLARGANINSPIANNSTFLHLLIVNKGTLELVTAFINDFNADIFAMDIDGHRSIESCILVDPSPCNVLQTFLQLSKVTTELFFNRKLNKSILQFAQDNGKEEAARVIQTELNRRLWTVVLRASTKDEINQRLEPEVKLLVEYKAEIDHKHRDNKDYDKWTVLHLACKTSTKAFVQFLIEQCHARIDLPNGRGDLPISIAAEHGHLATVEYLNGERGASLNESNKEKQTPLHLAAQNSHFNVVRYLVRWGANRKAMNVSGQTPLMLARNSASRLGPNMSERQNLMLFLQRLKRPVESENDHNGRDRIVPSPDLDLCELPEPPSLDPLGTTEKRISIMEQFFDTSPNAILYEAAATGNVPEADAAIQQGADICSKRDGATAYRIAFLAMQDYHKKATADGVRPQEQNRLQTMRDGCQKIIENLQQIAQSALITAIQKPDAHEAVAYLEAGAPVTSDLLDFVLTTTDDAQILDYLVRQHAVIRKALSDYTTEESPYRIAQRYKHSDIAAYIKYTLSEECVKAVAANDSDYVRKLLQAGASPDMPAVSNLDVALRHRNPEIIRLLCDYGARMNEQWFEPNSVTLSPDVLERLPTDIAFQMNRSFLNRQLRYAAAAGDVSMFEECILRGADINAENCHGSTALLYAIKHGNYLPIGHTLISRGATILHSNLDETISLVDLAKQYHYEQTAEHLSAELNRQFLTSILNNDRKSAARFEALGADFNYQDEQGRTPLHYAVQYHGAELVAWLTDRGSTPMRADKEGTFPIHEAVKKGDYAVSQLLINKFPTTRQQKTKSGETVLQLAQKNGFTRIAYLVEHGVAPPDTLKDQEEKPTGSKYSWETLRDAASNGQMQIIRDFCEEQYESPAERLEICDALIKIAKQVEQQEVLDALQIFSSKLRQALRSKAIDPEDIVQLKEHHRKVLSAFLDGLSEIIANSRESLDPSDPKTYIKLFSNVASNVQQRSEELKRVANVQDINHLSDKDLQAVNQKYERITSELKKLKMEKKTLITRLDEHEKQLYKQSELSAADRKRVFALREECKQQLVSYECSDVLCQRQQESVLNRQNAVNFIKKEPNMYLFYRTIENRLQALFHAVLVGQGGHLQTLMIKKHGMGSKTADSASVTPEIIRIGTTILKRLKSTLIPDLSRLNKQKQAKELLSLTTLGNIQELDRIAADTAGLLTLYYREQLTMVASSQRIRNDIATNGMLKWLKDVFIDTHSGSDEEMSVIILADYITGWILDALKAGKGRIRPYEPISQQLWLCVAKYNPIQTNRNSPSAAPMGDGDGQLKIGIKHAITPTKTVIKQVSIRHLIGCASLVSSTGEIYQFRVSNDNKDSGLQDLSVFGYVYVSPFSDEYEVFQQIVDGRRLTAAKHDKDGNLLTRVQDIIEFARIYQNESDERTNEAGLSMETVEKVAQILRDKKYFLDTDTMFEERQRAQVETQVELDVLREEIKQGLVEYQTLLEAAREQLQDESNEAQDRLRRTADKLFQRSVKELNGHMKVIAGHLEKKIDERLNQVDQQMKNKSLEIEKIAEDSRNHSNKARQQATEANKTAQRAAEQAVQALADVKTATKHLEEARVDFEKKADQCAKDARQAIAQSTTTFEKTINDVRQKIEEKAQRTKEAAEQAAAQALESSRLTKESREMTGKAEKTIKEQIDRHKKAEERLLEEVKEIKRQNALLIQEARNAKQEAKRAAEVCAAVLARTVDSQPIRF